MTKPQVLGRVTDYEATGVKCGRHWRELIHSTNMTNHLHFVGKDLQLLWQYDPHWKLICRAFSVT